MCVNVPSVGRAWREPAQISVTILRFSAAKKLVKHEPRQPDIPYNLDLMFKVSIIHAEIVNV